MELASDSRGLTKKVVATVLVLAAIFLGLNLMASPASAHPDPRDPRLGYHLAWGNCWTVGNNTHIVSYARMNRTPGFSNIFNASSPGLYGERPGGGENYSGQWLYYRVLVYWTDIYGRTHSRAGNWIATSYGELGSHVPLPYIWVQQPDGSWRTASQGPSRYGDQEDSSVVNWLPGRGTYEVWADYYWGPINNSRNQTVYAGNRHYDFLGRASCQ